MNHGMRIFVTLIAIACALWAVDRFEFQSRYGDALWRAAQSQAELLNYEVKRWFRAFS
jgi:hypothetical protein